MNIPMLEALQSEVTRWLWDYYLLATVLLVAILLVTKLLAQPARRMAIHWSTAGGLLVLAVLCAIPGWSLIHMLSATVPMDPPSTQLHPGSQNLMLPSEPPLVLQQAPIEDAQIQIQTQPAPEPMVSWNLDFQVLSCLVFAAGSTLLLIWLTIGHLLMRRLCSRAHDAPTEVLALFETLSHRSDGRMPTLGVVARLPVAAAVGLLRPMVLLPAVLLAEKPSPSASLQGRTTDELRTILAHELAHIRHRDLWLLAIMRGILLLLWPHPLYWLWRRNVRLDQETLADAAAADVTDRTDYAEQLVAWARIATEVRPPRLASSVGLWESPSQLKRRIAILLDEKLTVLRECSMFWKFSSAFTLTIVVGCLSLVTLQPASTVAAKPVEAEATDTQSDSRWTKKLNNGAKVELLAIGTNARDEQTKWWDAAGKPLDDLPFEVITSTNISPLPNRQLAFRVHDLPPDAGVRWKTQPASNSSSGTIVIDGVKKPYGYYSHEFERPRAGATFLLRVGVSAGEWITMAKGVSAAHSSLLQSTVFSNALADKDGNAVVIVSHSLSDVDTRGVAFDKKGNEWVSTSVQGTAAGKQNQSQWTFVGLKPDQVKEFGLQIRQYEWVEFEDLPVDVHADSNAKLKDIEILSLDKTLSPTVPSDADDESTKVESSKADDPQMLKVGEVQLPFYRRLESRRKANSFIGLCVDENGEPLANVEIELFSKRIGAIRSQKSSTLAKTQSDSEGQFAFESVINIAQDFPNGITDYRTPKRNERIVTAVGNRTGRVPGVFTTTASDLASRGETIVWVMQQSQTLRGRVTDSVGNPVSGARVRVGHAAAFNGANDFQIGTAVSDAEGRYRIDHLAAYNAAQEKARIDEMVEKNPALAYSMASGPLQQVLVTHPSFAAKRISVQTIPGVVNAQLNPGSVIEGKVVLPAGEQSTKLADGVVYLRRDMQETKPGTSPVRYSFQVQSIPLDSQGGYRFESLPAGTYHLTADIPGWVTTGVENIVARVAKTITAPNIAMTRGGRVIVRLLDKKTGEVLRFDEPTPGWVNPHRIPHAKVEGRTSSIVDFSGEGVAEVQLAPGEYRITVSIPNVSGKGDLINDYLLGIKSPEDMNKLPTIKVAEGQTTKVALKMSAVNQQAQATTATFQASSSPGETDESDEDVIFFPVQQTVPSEESAEEPSARDFGVSYKPLINALSQLLEPPSDNEDTELANTRSSSVTVELASSDAPTAPKPSWTVQGRVTDTDGNGLAGVEVRAATGVATLLGGGKTITDKDGHYRLSFGPGGHTKISEHAPLGVGVQAASIFASKPGWSEQNLCRQGDLLMSDLTPETLGDDAKRWGKKSADDVVFADRPKTIDFVMQPAVILEGQFVETSRNRNVRDQQIWITGPELPPSSSVLASLKTDRKGKFAYMNLPTSREWRFSMRVPNTAIVLESKPFSFEQPGRYRCRLVLDADQNSGDAAELTLRVEDITPIGT